MKPADAAPIRPAPGANAGFPTLFDASALFESNRRTLLAAAEAQAHLLDRLRRSTEEMVRFLDQRLQDDRETARRLAACATLPEMWSETMRFLQRGSEDYATEAGALAASAASQGREAADDLRREAEALAGTERRSAA